MTAHVEVREGGRIIRTICPACGIDDPHPTAKAAQAAAREHNRTRHAFPEHTLTDTGDETR